MEREIYMFIWVKWATINKHNKISKSRWIYKDECPRGLPKVSTRTCFRGQTLRPQRTPSLPNCFQLTIGIPSSQFSRGNSFTLGPRQLRSSRRSDHKLAAARLGFRARRRTQHEYREKKRKSLSVTLGVSAHENRDNAMSADAV